MARRTAIEVRVDAALGAWQRHGLPVGAVEIAKDGTVRIVAAVDRKAESDQDARKPDPWT